MQVAMLSTVISIRRQLLLGLGRPLGSLSSSLEGLRFAKKSAIAFDPDFRQVG
jgi:hypothetical protein